MIRYTPEKIAALRPNEIFVFGSNLAGHHGGGAASIAHERFGAVWGIGTGLQGNSYAIYGAQNEAYMSRSAEKWVRGLCFNELGVCG